MASDDVALGLGAAVEVAMAGALPLADAEQLDLIRDDLPGRDPAAAVAQVRRVGRPPGARNRRTGEMVAFLSSRYADPLEILAQAYSRPVEVLAAELGCDKAAAFGFQMRAAAEAAPYWHSKKPVAVAVDQRTTHLVLQGFGEPSGPAADGSPTSLIALAMGFAERVEADAAAVAVEVALGEQDQEVSR